jgi:hypothetical protein
MPASRVDALTAGAAPALAGRAALRARGCRAGWALGALAWLALLWHLPNEQQDLRPAFFLTLALEAVLLAAALALLPIVRRGRPALAMRHAVALATLLLVTLCLTDLGVRLVLDRPLAPLLDLHIAPAVINLLSGSLRGPIAWLAALAFTAAVLSVYGLSAQAVGALQRAFDDPPLRRAGLGLAAAALTIFAGQQLAREPEAGSRPWLDAHASQTLWHQWQHSLDMLQAIKEFEHAIAVDYFRELPPDHLLAGLGGADVLLVFFESYGRSALEQPRYADALLECLGQFDRKLAEHGLAAASSYVTSPTMGGQSWLAHGTLESGLWLSHQSYYNAFITSGRLTLTRAFNKAGYRTVAVKPAITKPWLEGPSFGFEQIYAAADLGYAGKPYNWVTMPDQYTFSAFERAERTRRAAAGGRPLYAEFSLISSHAPWTQIPHLVEDWDAIGDGAIFSQWAELGDPPQVVWRDPERVREQYRRSLDYVLDVLASYAARFVDERTVLIVVGDHQPAPLITGEGVSRDVPMHVITGNPALLEPFLNWGMVAGMVPAEEAPVRRMDDFRDWFLAAFSK